VVSAYVEKKRRLENNLTPVKAEAPVEVGAVWTVPGSGAKTPNRDGATGRLQAGHFFVDHGQIVAHAAPAPAQKPGQQRQVASAASAAPIPAPKLRAPSLRLSPVAKVGNREPVPSPAHDEHSELNRKLISSLSGNSQ
jgi:hypothetical protein